MSLTDTPLLSDDTPPNVDELGKRERNKLDKRRRIVAAAAAHRWPARHGREILAEVGYGVEKIDGLIDSGILSTP